MKKPRAPYGGHARFMEAARAFQGDECLIWPYATIRGYAATGRGAQRRYVCRLLCEELYGVPAPGMEAAHSCGNGARGCVNPRHLRWATRQENVDDTKRHGTLARGERNGQAKLARDDVDMIIRLRGRRPQSQIARDFGISQSAVSRIQTRENWAWLDGLAAKQEA